MRPLQAACACLSTCLAALLVTKGAAADSRPISVTFDTDFLGYDGKWSAAQIRVGSPEQYLSAFPGTISSETWVVGPDGCDSSLTCQDLRGGLFYSNESQTWQSLGPFELGRSALTAQTDYGYYGFDNLSVVDNIIAPGQIVAVLNSTEHWIGQLGLGVEEVRFQTQVNHRSFLSTLVQNESVIPSHSYGYTAGAYYRQKSTVGSLTLGGVDSTRFTPNDVSFTLADGYVPMVAITALQVQASPSSSSVGYPVNWGTNPLQLMDTNQAALFTIDTSTPFLWLPKAICDNIATALNLTYDDSIQLYMYGNGSNPSNLTSWGLNFTFTLANAPGSMRTVSLSVPFDAFNHQLSYPFPGLFPDYNSTLINYFPLRRANNTDQYTIGRMFLQETYLTVDYERNNFSLSQAVFPDTAVEAANLVPISSAGTWPGSQSHSSSGLSTGAKAGIGVGVAVIVIVICALLWWCCFRKRRQDDGTNEKGSSQRRKFFSRSRTSTSPSSSSSAPAELLADRQHPTEMVADGTNSRFELAGSAPIEMPAGDVSPAFFQQDSNNSTISRNDPRNPTELFQADQPVRRSSTSKDTMDEIPERSETPAPAYSSSESGTQSGGQQQSYTVSPYSTRPPRNPFGAGTDTSSSGEQGISPVTGSGSDRDQRSDGNNSHSGSSNYSRMRPSPVSPVSPSSRMVLPLPDVIEGRHRDSLSDPSSGTNSSTNTDPNNGLLTAANAADTQQVERSSSRNSRFREVLPDQRAAASASTATTEGGASSTQPPDSQTLQRPLLERARFSWEG